MKTQFHFSAGNSKLKKTAKLLSEFRGEKYKIFSFSLPAPDTCPYAGACSAICYAQQGHYRHKPAMRVRQHNLDLVKSFSLKALIDALNEDIGILKKSTKAKIVIRLHDSGDFSSEIYVYAWLFVAMNNPDVEFYAYTKSARLLPRHMINNEVENVTICCSFGGKDDAYIVTDLVGLLSGVIVSRIFPVTPTGPKGKLLPEDTARAHAEMRESGYVDGNSDEYGDLTLLLGNVPRIGLVYHGTKKMTSPQVKALTWSKEA